MKKLIPIIMLLLFVSSVYAQNETTSTTPNCPVLSPPYCPSPCKLIGSNATDANGCLRPPNCSCYSLPYSIYSFLVSVNPILLIILGVVLVLVSKLAKFVGVVLIIIAIIHLIFLFWK